MPDARPSPRRHPSRLPLAAALLLGAILAGCLTGKEEDPGYVLHLSLHDSLTRYDSISVVIADAANPEAVVEKVFSGPLPVSGRIPATTLRSARDPFLVRVRGMRGSGQVGLETHIYYQGGAKRVVHVPKPPLPALNWLSRLSPIAGTLDPPLDTSRTAYKVTPPEGADSVSLDIVAAYHKAVLVVDGQPVPSGRVVKSYPAAATTRVVPVLVTDLNVTRSYTVEILPPPAVRPRLTRLSIAPAGIVLSPAFTPEGDMYTATAPSSTASVTLTPVAARQDMVLELNGEPWFSGGAKPIALDAPGTTRTVTLVVFHGNARKEYTLFISRAQ